MDVLIQAGHSGIFQPYKPGGGGAPLESSWTADLANRVAGLLREHPAGLSVALVGHWFGYPAPDFVRTTTFKKAYSYHYDAAIYASNTGGFCDRYRPYGASDPRRTRALAAFGPPLSDVPLESQTFADHMRLRRVREVGIPLRAAEPGNPNADVEEAMIANWHAELSEVLHLPIVTSRRNPNTWDYYAYRDTTSQTPMMLIEFGVGQGLDRDLLFNHTDDVAMACYRATLRDLGIPLPEPEPEEADEMAQLTAAQRDLLSLMDPPLSMNADSVRGLVNEVNHYRNVERPALQAEVSGLRSEKDGLARELEQCRNATPPTPPAPEPLKVIEVSVTRLDLAVKTSDGVTSHTSVGEQL